MAATAWDLLVDLGVRSDSIHAFVTRHSLLRDDVRFIDAHFWTRWQRTLLIEYMEEDSGWQEAIDELEMLLRKKA
ncbi:DUF2789 family protein [Nocardia cyriacigeorgica]|uniref:DUF2789 family protein n=1 Tax=Nocardia cyriacigeorgica TaxID=135487 RepID=UPI0024575FA6|nr:DUF2789 family protein [Nocardia cyriacigeorgica]